MSVLIISLFTASSLTYMYSYNTTVMGKCPNVRTLENLSASYLVLRVTHIPSTVVLTGNILSEPNTCLPLPLFVTFNLMDDFLYCVYNLVNA